MLVYVTFLSYSFVQQCKYDVCGLTRLTFCRQKYKSSGHILISSNVTLDILANWCKCKSRPRYPTSIMRTSGMKLLHLLVTDDIRGNSKCEAIPRCARAAWGLRLPATAGICINANKVYCSLTIILAMQYSISSFLSSCVPIDIFCVISYLNVVDCT